MNKISTIALLLTTMGIGTAHAAGYQLSEYSATGMGRAFAGGGVVGDDFSAIGFNPAGMQFNATGGLQAGSAVISIGSDYKGDNGFGVNDDGHTRITRAMPSGFAQYKLNERSTLGLGIYIPFGLATDYNNDWFGRMHGRLSQITALNVSPAVSFQVTDTISLGASVNFQHAKARMTSNNVAPMPLPNAFKDLNGDDWGIGYTVGVTAEPVKGTRLGASYRSRIDHTLHGSIKMTGTGVPSAEGKHKVRADMTTPETVLLSAAHELNEKITLSATARWTRWSQFDNLDIIGTTNTPLWAAGTTISHTQESWKNTWFYAAGVDYKYRPDWTLRAGLAYDETAIKSPEFRTTRIPDGRRVWTSLGASYAKNNWQIDAGYTHIFVHGVEARGGEQSLAAYHPNIKYSSGVDMISLGLQYKF